MIQRDPQKANEIMGADVKQSGEQFAASSKYLRWQDKASNQKFFAGELQGFLKEAGQILLEIGVIKSVPDISSTIDTSYIK
jgi:NitT/TauT family transport system substrate-binding protein